MLFKITGFIPKREVKSRRDGTLLTVDFNLRTRYAPYYLQSPAGTAQLRIENGEWRIENHSPFSILHSQFSIPYSVVLAGLTNDLAAVFP